MKLPSIIACWFSKTPEIKGGTIVDVYVDLLDEGSPTCHGTTAQALGNGFYKLLPIDGYDPEDELWAFLPGDIVRLERHKSRGRKAIMMVRHPDPNVIAINVEQEGPLWIKDTNARHLGGGIYEVMATPQYDPANEKWNFPPGTKVRLKKQLLKGGFSFLLATEADELLSN
jgi:hypothetical protein